MEQDISYKGHIIEIKRDDEPGSPKNWADTSLFLVYEHRQFHVEQEGFEPREIAEYLNSPEDNHRHSAYKDYHIFPVEAHIHSGVSLKIFDGMKTCSFDSSVTGFALISKKEFNCDLNRKHNEKLKDKTDEEIYRHFAQGLLDTWNQYLSGDIYGFETYWVKKCSSCGNGEKTFVDSCWGYYGNDHEASGLLDAARGEIDSRINNEQKAKRKERFNPINWMPWRRR